MVVMIIDNIPCVAMVGSLASPTPGNHIYYLRVTKFIHEKFSCSNAKMAMCHYIRRKKQDA